MGTKDVGDAATVGTLSKEKNIVLRLGARSFECGIEGYPKPLIKYNIHHFAEPQHFKVDINVDYISDASNTIDQLVCSDLSSFKYIMDDLLVYSDPEIFKNDLSIHIHKIINKSFYKFGINSKNAKLLLIVNYNTSTVLIESVLAPVFLNKFFMRNIVILYTPLMACISSGSSCGIIIDIGWKDTRITPIFDYLEFENLQKFTNRGGFRLHYIVMAELRKNGFDISKFSFKEIENMIVSLENINDVNGNIVDTLIPKKLILHCIKEVYFKNNEFDDTNELSISKITSKLLLRELPIDARKQMAERIIIVGGITNLTGFNCQLIEKINSQMEQSSFNVSGIHSLGPLAGASLYSKLLKTQKRKLPIREIRRNN